MRQYSHGGDIYRNNVRIDLSKNINPLGMPENVKKAIIDSIDKFSDYPDALCEKLRERIAVHEGLSGNMSMENIVCGNGASELIHAICRAVKPHTGKIFPPTFSEYETAMRLAGCRLTTDESDITFVCTPNNPTGILTSIADLKALARESKLLVVDECFIDFTDGQSFVPELHNFTNVIILKAFTKIYSMAGLRLGYIVTANTELADMISAQIPCWSVSVPAQIAGIAALENTDWIERTKAYVKREREYLLNEMRKHVTVTESEANFVFFQTDKPVYEYMLERGILIRRWDERSYRIAVSTRENNAEFISALEQC